MPSKIVPRFYCHQYDIIEPNGHYERPPGAVTEALKHFLNANQTPTYEIGSSAEASFLELAKAHDFTPRRILAGAPISRQLDAFAFYHLGGMEYAFGFADKKFDTEHLLYEGQLSCTRELNPEGNAWSWGCGNGKRQIRKICVYSPSKVPKRDIFPPALWPYCNDSVLVVTRRLRDLLVAESLTGFELTPVLDGKRKWSARELEYDYEDEAQIEQAQWFQLTITARNLKPIPLAQPLNVNRSLGEIPLIAKPCSICRSHWGHDLSPYSFYEQVQPLERFANADLQLWNEFQNQDEPYLVEGPMNLVVASGRFMDLLVKNKFKGLHKASPYPYRPMLIRQEVEEVLPADVLAGYPYC